MIINFLGDSITAGAGAEKVENMFTTVLCKTLGATENNYGICGTRIARQTLPSDDEAMDETFEMRARKMDPSADLVFVFGGTNDYGHGDAMLGDIDSDSEYTFYGAFRQLVEMLITTYGKEKLLFLLPLPRYQQDDIYGENGAKRGGDFPVSRHDAKHPFTNLYPLSDYIRAEREVLEAYGIAYLDFADRFPEPKCNTGDELTMDGLHPNIKGHRILAGWIAEELKKRTV